ncbi:MAG: nicotinate-nucleotide adenylyltransferase [Candidatus Omnitrophota bacterium]|jgi:nicotinate-nucleotide adenylyltransferase
MKIGMLGGTFDPIHIGHLVLAQECMKQFELDKCVFIPAYIPPLKGESKVTAEDRLEMVRLALEGDPRFEISTYEIEKEGVSYSIDTIKHFKEKYGEDAELYFLTGSDAAESMSMWKDIDEILDLTHFVIAARPGWGEKSPYEDKITRINIPGLDISSSGIREHIKKGEPIDYFVPASVVRYIKEKGLYK